METLNLLIQGGSYGHVERSKSVEKAGRNNLRRRTEEVEYWKNKAGWYDDDASMAEYNKGVYDTYYVGTDSGASDYSGSSSSSSRSDGSMNVSPNQLSAGLKIVAAVLSILVAIIVFRVLSRRSSKKKVSSSSKSKSDGRSMRSRSRSRSGRSRSRSRRSSSRGPSSNYELMDDKGDRSRRSGRSLSRSRRSRSKSRSSKTRSKSRTRSKIPDSREVLV